MSDEKSIRAIVEGAPEEPAQGPDAPSFSHDALAADFTRLYGQGLRYVYPWRCWLRWSGMRWERENTLLVPDLVRRFHREVAEQMKDRRRATEICGAPVIMAVERLARGDRVHATPPEAFDRDPWKLNTPGGTWDLSLAMRSDHDPADLITKMTAVAPGGDCPLFLEFLERITGGRAELHDYVHRMAGYFLTGDISEHALFFGYGTGRNGKSTLAKVFTQILGDYATVASPEVFAQTDMPRHETELAMLAGSRLVLASETEVGRRWNEARIKAMTGGDRITARFMRQDHFSFDPTFKILVIGNAKPVISNVDTAIRRRLHLIPFDVEIPESEVDPDLPEKLAGEYPGILAWMIDGTEHWIRAGGLKAPQIVTAASASYLDDQDVFGGWLETETRASSEATERTSELYQSWTAHCERSGERPGSLKRFIGRLRDRGFDIRKDGHTRQSMVIGVRLRIAADGEWHP